MNNESQSVELYIDVDKIIASKNKKLHSFIPKFIIKYIKRVIHQDEINKFLKNNTKNRNLDFVASVIDNFKLKITVKNEDLIPREGKFIFVANHPLGALESMAMISTISKYHPNIKFLVNDILMNLKNLSDIFIPVNKHGKSPQEYFKMLDDNFNSDAQILIFPAGLVSRKIKGKIIDLEWRKSFVTLAKKHQRDIVPIHINARNSNFFYNLSNFRKKIGIKANIEMLYLPDQMYSLKNKEIILTIGETISHKSLTKEKNNNEWALSIRNTVYSLVDKN